MKLIITIDTEEDNWARYSTTDNPVENIERIIPLQRMFDRYGVKPTYLISYPVATNHRSVAILKSILEEGKCEIGMHCHPWNTPPFNRNAEIREYDTMLCNLPEEVIYTKLSSLYEAIRKNFAIIPVSFRAGRWGFNEAVARSLFRLGFHIDSSVTPFENWAIYQGPDFRHYEPSPFRFDPDNIALQSSSGAMLQVPVSIGFLQRNFRLCHRITQHFEKWIYKRIHMKGILSRLGLVNKVWLSPEVATAGAMAKLAKRMMTMKFSCLNMTFHSTSLTAGFSPFVQSNEQEATFFSSIAQFLEVTTNDGIESSTLAQFEDRYQLQI